MIYQTGCQPAGGLGGQTSKNSGFPLPFLPDKTLSPNSPNISKTVFPTCPKTLFTLINPPRSPERLIRLVFKGVKMLRRLKTGNKV